MNAKLDDGVPPDAVSARIISTLLDHSTGAFKQLLNSQYCHKPHVIFDCIHIMAPTGTLKVVCNLTASVHDHATSLTRIMKDSHRHSHKHFLFDVTTSKVSAIIVISVTRNGIICNYNFVLHLANGETYLLDF